jgi:hypothetical protein
VPGGEHQSGVDPGLACPHAVGILLLAPKLQRRDTQFGQRQRYVGCVGPGLTADELVTDTLELLIDVQLRRVQVDAVPGQAKNFTPAQA